MLDELVGAAAATVARACECAAAHLRTTPAQQILGGTDAGTGVRRLEEP